MNFSLEKNGVGKKIIPNLLEEAQKKDIVIYWVTYTVTFDVDESRVQLDPIFDFFEKLNNTNSEIVKPKVRIICRHPISNNTGSVASAETLSKLNELGIEVRGLKTKYNALPDEADIDSDEDDDEEFYVTMPESDSYGGLHAKFIVSASGPETNRQSGTLMLGSFNFSYNSLRTACESFAEIDDSSLVLKAFNEADKMWQQAEKLTDEDCRDFDLIPISPVEGIRQVPDVDIKLTYSQHFQPLLKVLDEKLKNYPQKNQDFQWRVFADVWKRNRLFDIIYLPVGCGKTYIALRWILQKLADAWENKKSKPKVWYLTPNQWIQKTVRKAFLDLLEEAKLTSLQRNDLQNHIIIGRASVFFSLADSAVAVVADEFHNWAPEKDKNNYTRAINILRKREVNILGMSATPCRIEAGKFDRSAFLRPWIGAQNYMNNDSKPLLNFQDAVQLGYVCNLSWQTIAKNKKDEIDDILQTATTRLGDYADIVLGRVWDVLAGSKRDANNLADEIISEIQNHCARRIVIFLPPVADRLKIFINAFENKFNHRFSKGSFFDFRSNSGAVSNDVFQKFATNDTSTENPHVLLTINRFSEGVSVNDIDLLVMLRPTLSPRVAVQQIGRGVRNHFSKTKCVILDAVYFKNRWDEWNGLTITSSFLKNSSINIQDLGRMTVAAARDQNLTEDISVVTGLAPRVVQRRLNQGGRTQVNNAFDEWPIDEENEEDPEKTDIEALGDMTVAAARDENRTDDIAKVTGLAPRVVQRRLSQGGRTQVRNAFDEWPIDEENKEDLEEIDIEVLGDMTVAAARDENRIDDISKVTGLAPRVVQRRLNQGGRTQVKNAFDEWPLHAD